MWSRNPDVLVTDLDDETVLMHPDSAEMFSLNSSGRLLWEALPADTAALSEHLRQTFELGQDQAAQDVATWLDDMHRRGLLQLD